MQKICKNLFIKEFYLTDITSPGTMRNVRKVDTWKQLFSPFEFRRLKKGPKINLHADQFCLLFEQQNGRHDRTIERNKHETEQAERSYHQEESSNGT